MCWFWILAGFAAALFASVRGVMTTEALQAFIDLLFLNTNWANIGDATGLRASSSAGSFFLSLHTANPGTAGSQTTSECTYTGYARIPVARSGAGWTRTGTSLSPTASIDFGQCTAGSETATYAGFGTASSGAGHLVCAGTITPNIGIVVGVTPQLTTASTFVPV